MANRFAGYRRRAGRAGVDQGIAPPVAPRRDAVLAPVEAFKTENTSLHKDSKMHFDLAKHVLSVPPRPGSERALLAALSA